MGAYVSKNLKYMDLAQETLTEAEEMETCATWW